VLGEHQRLLREAFAKHGGQEIDTQGDAFFIAFASARDAVLAAMEAQRAVSRYPWPDGASVKVRMGVHTGQASPVDGRYTGLAVHRAARICAAAHGGQVLVSQATQTLLEDEEEDLAVGLRDLGEQRLKDLDRPVRLYQLAAPGLPAEFPPLRRDEEAHAPAVAPPLPIYRRRVVIAAAAGAVILVGVLTAILALTRSGDGPSADAEAARVQPLPTSFCSPIQYGSGTRPRLLVVSDQGLRGPDAEIGNQMAAAIEYVLRENGFKAGRHAVAYQACDDSSPDVSGDPVKCATNARAYAENVSIIGIVGPTLSVCAKALLPLVNRARGGAIPVVSPSNTAVGLTRRGIGAEPQEPGVYYPSGARNYVRLMPADDLESAANAMLARRLGLSRVFVVTEDPGLTGAFRSAATKLGIEIAGEGEWSDDSTSYRHLGLSARRSGADAVFIGAPRAPNGARLVKDLRAVVGADVQLLAHGGFSVRLDEIGRAAEGMTVSLTGLAPIALRGEGKRFLARLATALADRPSQFAVYAAQATQLLLDAIARSDGTRASVLRKLFASQVRNGILGDFDVTEAGDTTANHVTIYRVVDGRLRFREVITPPVSLIVRG
jgi:ABC-type branched-subunit amino acid transport system substrate-binding protein